MPNPDDIPLRKVIADTDRRSNEAVRRNAAQQLHTGQILLKKVLPSAPRPDSFFEYFSSRRSVEEPSGRSLVPGNFSLSTLGDHLCRAVDTTLIGAAHGRIDSILLTVPTDGENAVNGWDERHLKRLMGLMDAHTRFHLLCHAHQLPTLEGWLPGLGISPDRVHFCLSVFDYTIWAQDAYVSLSTAQQETILCEGVCFTRGEDMSIADDVAAQSECRALQSYLFFQGGNVLGTRDFALIGTDYVKRNVGRAQLETEEKVLDRFGQLFGKPIISLGRAEPIPREHRFDRDGIACLSGLYQPLFHIDMYVTPTGVIGPSGKEVCMVGRPGKARAILGEGAGPLDYDFYFEQVETQLRDRFETVQLPLYPTARVVRAEKRHYHLTYNNALLENYVDEGGATRRVVYMPTFAEDADFFQVPVAPREALDAAAEAIWRSVGFEVRKMDGLEDLATGWGCLHCITKALRRTAYAS